MRRHYCRAGARLVPFFCVAHGFGSQSEVGSEANPALAID
jgi:hypothetical protein